MLLWVRAYLIYEGRNIMKILECYIENFGKIKSKRFEFSDGFNTILAENGYGKTTLSVFIKCMLYGMSDTRKLSLDENERKRYLPWSGALASGSLTLSVGEKIYRIERSFAPKAADDKFALYDTSLGRESKDYTENIGEELLGVDAESFERTLFLSERNLSPKNDNKSISSKLSLLVGFDGDVSGMDNALKLLEEQRKFYSKKGGSGEIADVKLEISKLEDRLCEVERGETRARETELALSELDNKEAALRKKETDLIREREEFAKLSAKESYKATLENMKISLQEAQNEREQLVSLFGGAVPTEASLERARAIDAEIKILRTEAASHENTELIHLKKCFENTTSPEKAEEIKACLDRVKNGSSEASSELKKYKQMFTKRVPKESEITELLDALEAQDKTSKILLFSAVFLTVLGFALGFALSPLLFALCVAGPLLAIFAVILNNKAKEKNKKAISAFYKSISDTLLSDNQTDRQKLLELLSLLHTGDGKEDEDIEKLRNYATLFGLGEHPASDVQEILSQYERYRELLAIERYKERGRIDAEQRLKEREAELSSFVSGFISHSDNPLFEMGEAVKKYMRLCDIISSKEADILNLTSTHTEHDISSEKVRSAEELKKLGDELSADFSDISTKRALLLRQYQTDTELIESKEELIAKKRELEEKFRRHTENLETIKLTKKFLDAAKDSMTSKYLGKTKESFKKYAEIISGSSGEFEMDTSFSVSKIEGAKTHTAESFSRGMRDIYNIAARFALIDSLYEKEEPFVILDDPFTAFDDEKCRAALHLVHELSKERQIIYFTCSESRT